MVMNKTAKRLMFVAAAAVTLFSCQKEKLSAPETEGEEELQEFTITADYPDQDPTTRTELVGTTPYWSVGDAIGVSVKMVDVNDKVTYGNRQFTTDIAERSTTATFTGMSTTGTQVYAYYPYYGGGVTDDGRAKVLLPAEQHPTVSSFDGAADLLVSEEFSLAGGTVENLRFGRLGAILKLILKGADASTATTLAGQYLSSLTFEAESDLVGNVYINLPGRTLGGIYTNTSTSVQARYTSSTHFLVDGSNAVWFVVYPQTLASGSTISVSAVTDDYNIVRSGITLPRDFELQQGKINTLTINVNGSHLSAIPTGAALPYDYSLKTTAIDAGMVTRGGFTSPSVSGLRLASGSQGGYVETKALDLSSAFTLALTVKPYDPEAKVVVSAGDELGVIETSGSDEAVYYLTVSEPVGKNAALRFSSAVGNRVDITNILVISGTTNPPIINVTTPAPVEVANTQGVHEIEYSITRPNGETVSVEADVDWIHDFDCSEDGVIGFEVDAQGLGVPARSGVITISYPNASPVYVTVEQAAGAGAKASYSLLFNSGTEPNNSSYTGSYTATSGGMSWTVASFNNNNNGWSGTVKCGRNGNTSVAYIATKSAVSEAIKMVSVTYGAVTTSKVNSATLVMASDAGFTSNVVNQAMTIKANTTVRTIISSPVENRYYKIVYDLASGTSNGFVALSEVVLSEGSVPMSTVTTGNSADVRQATATINGSFAGAAGTIYECGFYWGTASDDLSEKITTDGSALSSGNFSCQLTSLNTSTKYYYKAYVLELNESTGLYEERLAGNVENFTTTSAAEYIPSGWLELPAVTGGEDFVGKFYGSAGTAGIYRNYTYNYDYDWHGCLWVAYPLTSAHTSGSASTGSWNYNPNIYSSYQVSVTGSSYTSNYGNSKYSRGHQIPNADRKSDDVMNSQTYYVTNQTPQLQDKFNASIWGSLEGAVRGLLSSTDTVYVATGACYRKAGGSETVNTLSAAKSGVRPATLHIPNYYWKALLKVKRNGSGGITSASAIGFWFVHKEYEGGDSYTNYVVSVDEIESNTGFDLFTNLAPALQASAEANTNWTDFRSF